MRESDVAARVQKGLQLKAGRAGQVMQCSACGLLCHQGDGATIGDAFQELAAVASDQRVRDRMILRDGIKDTTATDAPATVARTSRLQLRAWPLEGRDKWCDVRWHAKLGRPSPKRCSPRLQLTNSAYRKMQGLECRMCLQALHTDTHLASTFLSIRVQLLTCDTPRHTSTCCCDKPQYTAR